MLKKILIILSIVLILINVYLIYNYGFFERRLIRLISTCCYFLVFILFKSINNKNIFFAFIFLICVDILGLYYEKGLVSIIGPAIKLIAYAFIIKEIIKKVKIKGLKKPITLLLGLVVLLNLFLVYQTVSTTFFEIKNYAESTLYLVYGSVNILMCILTINYNFRYPSKKSIYYTYFVFALIISDASWFIAYYINASGAFYFDILFYLLAFCFMIFYAESKSIEDVVLDEKI